MSPVVDAWGDEWTVSESRDTVHGWVLHLGRPASERRRQGTTTILTRDLVDYLESVRYRRGAIDLPLGGTAIRRIRKLLGHNIYDDRASWWEEHADELASVPYTEFARRHSITPTRVGQVGRSMFGARVREPGWWRLEPARSLLISDLPRQRIAEELGISVGAVGRLRWVLRREDQRGEEA